MKKYNVRCQAGESYQDMTTSQLQQLAAAGMIGANDEINPKDTDRWVPASKVKGLFPDDQSMPKAHDEPKAAKVTGQSSTSTNPSISQPDRRPEDVVAPVETSTIEQQPLSSTSSEITPTRPTSLIDCPSCRQKISRRAATCPSCGHPVAGGGHVQAQGGKVQTIERTSKPLKLQSLLSAVLTIVGFIIACLAILDGRPVSDSSIGVALCTIGLIWFIIVRFLIWWHHA